MASLIEARREVTGEEETEGESLKDRTGDRGERHQRTKMSSGQRNGSIKSDGASHSQVMWKDHKSYA